MKKSNSSFKQIKYIGHYLTTNNINKKYFLNKIKSPSNYDLPCDATI
jgi:hypothetical protein